MIRKRIRHVLASAGMCAAIAGSAVSPCVFAIEMPIETEEDSSEETVTAGWEAIPDAAEVDIDEIEEDDGETVEFKAAGESAEGTTEEDTEIADEGQPGNTVYSVGNMNRTNAVSVIFNLDVPDDMVTPCIVTFVESETYTEYYIEAYNTAGYQTTAYLEPGTYLITDGYPTNDNISAYTVVDKSYFTVEEGKNMSVNVTIRSKGDILRGDLGSTEEASEEELSAETEGIQPEEKKSNVLLYLFAAVAFTTIGVGIGVFGLKYLEKTEY